MHNKRMTRKQANDRFKKAVNKAKQIRKGGEKFSTAVKRAFKQIKK